MAEIPRQTRSSILSSGRFAVILEPDPAGRRLVFGTGVALLVTGVCLCLTARLPIALKLLAAVAWTADCLLALRRQWLGTRRVQGIRLCADGSVVVFGGGTARTASLMTGSVVLERLAWLRIRWPDGSRHAELLTARNAGAQAWQRLHLIWRQADKSFSGRPRP